MVFVCLSGLVELGPPKTPFSEERAKDYSIALSWDPV